MSRKWSTQAMAWLALAALLGAVRGQAEPVPFDVEGYSFELTVDLTVEPGTAFDVMTGDVSPWWDHTMSKEPHALYIEPHPGGAFMERFDETGEGVEHARVTYAKRGDMLRMVGPLGLAGRAFHMVTTWTYKPTDQGCRVTCTVNMLGQVDAKLAGVVETTWKHFLFEQLQPYIESGMYKKELDSP